ncbi:MAG: hypothetical protein M3Y87_10910 [Myxococcota bacterium]|nr:hypothetical protein [Myxococcota bacterium]
MNRSISNVVISNVMILAIAHALVACGGARPIGDDATARSEDGDGPRRAPRRGAASGGDEEEEEEEVDPAIAAERRELADFPLGPRIAIPGTGISVEPPRGSERSGVGSTLVHPRRRIQIVIAAAEGDLSVHQQFRTGLRAEAEEIESEEIEINGEPATLIVDRMSQGDVELERVWAIQRNGTRSGAVMGVYAADRAEVLRDYLRASIRTMQLDPSVAIDPEVALGWRVQPGEGLQLVRAASTNVSYSPDGQPPPGVGAPMLLLMPLPVEVPASERAALCPQILAQLVQVSSADAAQGTIDAGEVTGCDTSATTTDEPRLTTYAALVFRGDAAFMVVASANAAPRSPWLQRFRAAARTLEPVATE